MEAKSISRKAPLACDVSIFLDGLRMDANTKYGKKIETGAMCHPQNITKTRSGSHQLKPFKGDGESTPGVNIAHEKRKDFEVSANVKKKKKTCFIPVRQVFSPPYKNPPMCNHSIILVAESWDVPNCLNFMGETMINIMEGRSIYHLFRCLRSH